ncbi:endonuclease G, mitochondrial isoform X3 [Gadus morhua]|uniref:endonuclease G, mitochondrial isoform X3 n=1 Tax=Gadus morhua TaxID=8049 RepID=UPI0011B546C0|nr:endonuclease G, mitochondrial isoform X3 [Gadus morhua]
MQRVLRSPWFAAGVSLAIGTGVGASLHSLQKDTTASSTDRLLHHDLHSLLSRVPVIPLPSVEAATELTVYRGGPVGSKPGAVMKYGFPSLANIKSRESYITSYDPRTRTASWVIEQLTPGSLTGSSDRKYSDFKEDDSVHVYHRSTNQDYKGSGFDRGHLAAAANHKWSQKAMDDTFILSNVSPQRSFGEKTDLTSRGRPTPKPDGLTQAVSSSQPEGLEQLGAAVSLSDQTIPQCLRLHWTPLPAQWRHGWPSNSRPLR